MINLILEKSCEDVPETPDEKPESVGAILQRNPLVQEALSKNNLLVPVTEEYNNTAHNIPLLQDKTVKSDKTDFVDNNNFLRAVFGSELHGVCPLIVNFSGNPKTVSGNKWSARPWNEDFSFVIEHNNYFSLSTFRPDDSGKYRRNKTSFYALYAIMLDDVGTKVGIDRLTLPPSWLLETSPENYQAGYLLIEPLTKAKSAEQLMNAIINAGLCDPGANGPTTRLARLPIAGNGKHEPIFLCQMKDWFPERRYSVQELVDGLQLDIIDTKPSKQEKKRASNKVDMNTIHVMRPENNPVISALQKRNLYKASLGNGKHDITCLWKDEHTDAIDSGTAYFEPNDDWPNGGYSCMHGHCAERHISDLLNELGLSVISACMKPEIRVVNGEIHRIVDAAENELAGMEKYYQRGGLIVTVSTDPETNRVYIQPISKPALIKILASIVNWMKFSEKNGWQRIDPPDRHVLVLFNAADYKHLPVLCGLAHQPYLRSDNSIVVHSGYDVTTQIYGVFDAKKFVIPASPSRADAANALAQLWSLLEEFPFAQESDRSAALAAILTAAIRPSLPFAPMFHVRAHTVSSGKSYLCALVTAFASSQQGTPTTFPADDEECRKLLLAELLHSPAVIEFDNMTSDILPHKSLCTALTSGFMSGRILGVSKTAVVNTRTLFLSSGNNVVPIKDMTRRCVTINLNPEIETPAERKFKRPNLIAEVHQERERYVSAALTIIWAWTVAGRPMSDCKPLAGFGDWSDLCRQSLLWLGCCDPSISIFEAMQEDPDREQLGRLLMAWHCVFGNTPVMVREVIRQAEIYANEELKETLMDIAGDKGEINRRKFGRWIKQHLGQIVEGLRFVRYPGNFSSEKWRVESVLSLSSVANQPSEQNSTIAEEYRLISDGE